jgi:hypothetical protein
MIRSRQGAIALILPQCPSRGGGLAAATLTGAEIKTFADGTPSGHADRWSSPPGPDRMLGCGRKGTAA